MGMKGNTPLDPSRRYILEKSLGNDFSSVDVHNGESNAGALGARGYSPGENVYFNQPGQYQRDHELLGHELSHVVQQKTGTSLGPFKP